MSNLLKKILHREHFTPQLYRYLKHSTIESALSRLRLFLQICYSVLLYFTKYENIYNCWTFSEQKRISVTYPSYEPTLRFLLSLSGADTQTSHTHINTKYISIAQKDKTSRPRQWRSAGLQMPIKQSGTVAVMYRNLWWSTETAKWARTT